MAKVLFLSEQALKENTIINDNVDMKYLTPTIWDAQQYYILPALGTALYNELKAAVEAGVLSDALTTLMQEYVQPYFIQCLKIEVPPVLLFKYQNKNLATKSSENSQPVGMDEMLYLVDQARNKAEYLARRLRLFLLANPTIYPTYLNQGDAKIDTVWPRKDSYTNGMFLGDIPRKRRSSIGYDPGIFRDCENC